jgi:hypothetical protein
MVRKRLIGLAAFVSLVLAAVASVLLLRSPVDRVATPSSATPSSKVASTAGAGGSRQHDAPAPFAFTWPAGNVYTYGLKLDVSGTFAPAGSDQANGQAPLAALLALEADLALRSYGRLDGEGDFVLGVRLASVTRIDWTLGTQPVLPDDGRSLVGPELVLVAASEGEFRGLHVSSDDYYLLINLCRQILAPLQVVVSSGHSSWTRRQTNPTGNFLAAYEVSADGSSSLSLLWRPVRYIRLAAGPVLGNAGSAVTGEYSVILDRAGHLERVGGKEELSVTRADGEQALRQVTRIQARLQSVTRVEPGPQAAKRLAGLVSTGLGDTSTSEDAARRLLEQQAGGLTIERLMQDLRIHGPAPKFPDLGRWMWQATGLLRLHPELCRDLKEVFKAPQMNHQGRARVLDLLAATGTREAQAVMRELLDTPEARGTVRYELLLQRFSLVERPTAETMAYLRAKVERGDGAYVQAAAHSLGSAIGNRLRTEGEPVDERSAALLRKGLAAARSARERVDWLRTLGNAGLTEDVSLMSGYAKDGDRGVRAAVADALRKTQTPAAEKTLLELVADVDSGVRDRALHTLTSYTLTADHLDALRQQVESGRLEPDNFAMLMTLLERNKHQPGAVLPVLETLHARNISDRRLLLRIRALYGSLSSGIPPVRK